MPGDVLNEARACLDFKLEEFGIFLSDEERAVAASAVAVQIQKLDSSVQEVGPEADVVNREFIRTDIAGRLANPVETPIVPPTKAQEATGCFATISPNVSSASTMKIALKDIFKFDDHQPTAGLPTPPLDLNLPCSPLKARLESAGAEIVGTTKLSAWCYLPYEFNELVDPPRNPLGKGLLVGGSSSGSAVAVASGAVHVAVGSDTGGSIRIPAALCGVYGYKPSRGTIPEHGAVPLSVTQDTIGLLAKSPVDLAATFEVLSTHNEQVSSLNTKQRVGVPKNIFSFTSSQCQSALIRLTNALERLDIVSEEVAPLNLDQLNSTAGLITGYEAGAYHGPRMALHPVQYPASVRHRLITGLAVPEIAYSLAQANRLASLEEVRSSTLSRCSFILSPVLRRHGPKISEWGDSGDLRAIGKLSLELLYLNRWVNLLGLPSISIPIPVNDTLPSAIQIVGAPGSDRALLELAMKIDKEFR